MRMRIRTFSLIATLALATAALAGQGDLWLRKAKLTLKSPRPGREPSHVVSLKGEFAPGDLTLHVDPTKHDVLFRVDGKTVFSLPAPELRDGLVRRTHGRWKFRETDVPRRRAGRLELDLSRGRFKVVVKDADLTGLLTHGREDVPIELILRGQVLDATPTFSTRGRRWSFRQGRNPRPPGSDGAMPPPDPDLLPGQIAPIVVSAGEMSDRHIGLDDWATDEAKWRVLWAHHSQTEAPFVNFETDMVIGVFLGARPTGGHTVVIEGVTASGEDLTIRVLAGVPAATCVVAQVVTYPYVLVRVPRHAGTVTFTKRVDEYTCKPSGS